LQGAQPRQSNRFILKGTLAVEWSPPAASEQIIKPRQLTLSQLSLLERTGAPGFNHHLLVAPERNRPGAQVNLHPLIVVDINSDGHDDIILPGVNKVLLNDGQANFRATEFILEENFYSLEEVGIIADFNGDGNLDFLGVAAMG